jgi:hypothetical protein
VISYLRSRDPSITYADWVWITTTKPIVQGTSMTAFGILAKRIGLKWALISGSIIYT